MFFFFQAEDGIRDVAVTGVQTCALPIAAILGGIFNSLSATAMLVGSVALLELVENAVMMLARIRLKNTRGESPPNTRTSAEIETAPCIRSPTRTTATYSPSFSNSANPKRDVTTKMSPNTP